MHKTKAEHLSAFFVIVVKYFVKLRQLSLSCLHLTTIVSCMQLHFLRT